jgi:tryptophan synthase alpha chain
VFVLKKLKEQKKIGFIPFVVVGDPDLESSERAVEILIEEGADIIELGVPFSDAMADGPVIQVASERASKTVSMHHVLEFAKKILKKHPGFPFVLFTYYNPVLRMGIESFAAQAKSAGIYAVLVVDLPPEEAEHYAKAMNAEGVKTVFLASPTTAPARFEKVSRFSTAFIYYVSRTGVTGTQDEVSASLASEMKEVRRLTQQPIAIGFGISNAAQARQVSQLGDAVVVGSAFVKLVSKKAFVEVRALAKEIRSSIDSPATIIGK